MRPEPKSEFRDASRTRVEHTDGATAVRRFVVASTNESARAAIEQILAMVDETRVSSEDLDVLEIALAEVLNNVVEHAYEGQSGRTFEVEVELKEPGMHFTIWDDGIAMPTGRLPGGRTADIEREGHEQAEGGYGLYLIRQLARKLRYERVGDRNKLSFRIQLTEI